MAITYILLFAVIGLSALYKINLKVLVSEHWPIQKVVLHGIGYFALYKFMVAIYAWIVMSGFGVSVEELAGVLSHFLATRQEILAILAVSGTGIGFLLICLLVPIYEEIAFRGVVLDAVQGYLNFNAANIFQSLMFAAIHLNLYLFPVFFLFGLVTGIMRKKSWGVLAGIIFHMINNLLAISTFYS